MDRGGEDISHGSGSNRVKIERAFLAALSNPNYDESIDPEGLPGRLRINFIITTKLPPNTTSGHCRELIERCESKVHAHGWGNSKYPGTGGWANSNGDIIKEPHLRWNFDVPYDQWIKATALTRAMITDIQQSMQQQCVYVDIGDIRGNEINLLGKDVESFPEQNEFQGPDPELETERKQVFFKVENVKEYFDAMRILELQVPRHLPTKESQFVPELRDFIFSPIKGELGVLEGARGAGKSAQLSLLWSNGITNQPQQKFFLTSGRRITSLSKDDLKLEIDKIKTSGLSIVIDNFCINLNENQFDSHLDFVKCFRSEFPELNIVLISHPEFDVKFRIRSNGIIINKHWSLGVEIPIVQDFLHNLNAYWNFISDSEVINRIEDYLLTERFSFREIEQNLISDDSEVLNVERINQWSNDEEHIKKLLLTVDSKDVSRVLAFHLLIMHDVKLSLQGILPAVYLKKLLKPTHSGLLEYGLTKSATAHQFDLDFIQTASDAWRELALGNLQAFREDSEFANLRENLPSQRAIKEQLILIGDDLFNQRQTIVTNNENNPLAEEVADAYLQIDAPLPLYENHSFRERLTKTQWKSIGEYYLSCLQNKNGESNPWIHSVIVKSLSERGIWVTGWAEDGVTGHQFLHLHKASLRDLGDFERLKDILDTPLARKSRSGEFEKASVYWNQGRIEDARKLCDEILADSSLDSDNTIRVKTLNLSGLISRDFGDFEKARGYWRTIIENLEESLEPSMAAQLNLLNLDRHLKSRPFDILEEGYKNLLSLIDRAKDPRMFATVLNNLGKLYFIEFQKHWYASYHTFAMYGPKVAAQGKELVDRFFQNSKIQFEKALKIRMEIGDSQGVAGSKLALAELHQANGENEQYAHLVDECLNYYVGTGELNGQILCNLMLGKFYLEGNDVRNAVKYATSAHQLATKFGAPDYIKQASDLIQSIIQRTG